MGRKTYGEYMSLTKKNHDTQGQGYQKRKKNEARKRTENDEINIMLTGREGSVTGRRTSLVTVGRRKRGIRSKPKTKKKKKKTTTKERGNMGTGRDHRNLL